MKRERNNNDDTFCREYKTRTVDAYNRIAPTIIKGFDEYFEAYARLEADHFLSTLSQGSVILDLGCGGGPASQYFIHRGYDIVSGDLCEAMLLESKKRRVPYLVRLDLEALPFHLNSFDAIWAHTSFVHIPKGRFTQALEPLVYILKDNGILFVALKGGQDEGYMDRGGEQMWFSQFHEHEFVQYIPKELEIIRTQRTQLKRGIFLNYHLVKRSE